MQTDQLGIVEALKPQLDLIPENAKADLKRLSELTGHSFEAVVAGWWIRFGEVQTLEINLHYTQSLLKNLDATINHPEIEDFLKGVQLEAAHQTLRWGIENEESSPPHHFILVMNKIIGKMACDIFDFDSEKFKHHVIAVAAEMFNIHRQICKPGTEIHKWFNNKKE